MAKNKRITQAELGALADELHDLIGMAQDNQAKLEKNQKGWDALMI